MFNRPPRQLSWRSVEAIPSALCDRPQPHAQASAIDRTSHKCVAKDTDISARPKVLLQSHKSELNRGTWLGTKAPARAADWLGSDSQDSRLAGTGLDLSGVFLLSFCFLASFHQALIRTEFGDRSARQPSRPFVAFRSHLLRTTWQVLPQNGSHCKDPTLELACGCLKRPSKRWSSVDEPSPLRSSSRQHVPVSCVGRGPASSPRHVPLVRVLAWLDSSS
jgi:hypothetical protein